MNFNDLKNQNSCLYFSKKNYRKMFDFYIIIFLISFPLYIFSILFSKDLEVLICTFYVTLIFILIYELISYKKIIINNKEIIFFNMFNKIIKTFPLNSDVKVIYTPMSFFFRYEKFNIRVDYEDNDLILSVLQRKADIKLLGAEKSGMNFDEFKFNSEKFYTIFISILIFINLCTLFFFYNHKNEIFSYFYVYQGKQYINKEKKIQNSDILAIDKESKNLIKAYNYFKKACILYANQQDEIYDYINMYAYFHNLEKDLKKFSELEKLYYSKN